MSLIKSLVRTVQAWCRKRGGPKTTKRAGLALERLDHRQLLSVNFTGNAAIDIPGPTRTGTLIFANDGNPATRHPNIPDDIKPLIKVSGLDINGVRLNYTPNDDILSIAIDQPDNQKTGQRVLAGDTDNNGDGATVAPDVKALRPAFLDFGYLGGSETMGVFLDLNNDKIPDVVAGISNTPGTGKLYQVANAIVNPDPNIAATTAPLFGTQLFDNTGASFLRNDPAQPSFEFQVTNFSQLYQSKTGHALAVDSIIGAGAFANSLDDDGISEAFFPAQQGSFGTIPTPPPDCPTVVTPPIKINPHENNHVNTAHPTDVRVYVFGSPNFNVNNIIASTVRLGGAAPIASFTRQVNNDGILDRTFVFRGSDIDLPRGITTATITGNLTDGSVFQASQKVFIRDDTFYSKQEIAERDARQAAAGYSASNPPLTPFQMGKVGNLHDLALDSVNGEGGQNFEATARSTVKIPTRSGVKAAQATTVTTHAAAHTNAVSSQVGTAAAAQPVGSTDDEKPLTVSIPRRLVTQTEAPVTVKVPKRSAVVPETHVARQRMRPLAAATPNRSAWARAARA